jgi:hypothetical protein
MMKTHFVLLYSLFFLLLITSCNSSISFDAKDYVTEKELDDILIQCIRIMHRLPQGANKETRWEERFDEYYMNEAGKFKVVHFAVKNDFHHIYLFRPARNVNNCNRGTAVRFKWDGTKLTDFEETFVTPMMPDDKIVEAGKNIFKHYVKTGTFGKYEGDIDWIEWPNNSQYYDKETNEWAFKK